MKTARIIASWALAITIGLAISIVAKALLGLFTFDQFTEGYVLGVLIMLVMPAILTLVEKVRG